MDGTTARSGLGRVVVGVDGSPSAHTAVVRAVEEAALRGSTLCPVHAADRDAPVPFPSEAGVVGSRQAGRESLDRTAEAITARHPEPAVVRELADDPAPGSPRRAAAMTGTIVVGHRGLGGFSPLSLGSVGSVGLEAAAAAPTPVVVGRGAAEPVGAGAVLAAVRDEADVGRARAAAREALLRKAPLRLPHLWNAGLTPGPRAASHHADLLVLGGRRSPGHLGPAPGRITLTLLRHAHCPVQLIPRQGPGHRSTS
ncbi:universal stress protein [Streptomyces sp. NK15101]|uniref:universal stress protein n=1 Tax=Streptomyces sp. NK15101 TaxID=2873261 RepID=UPI001CEC1987|nr:universal stress protein [Streptomyces sp. NK15101]